MATYLRHGITCLKPSEMASQFYCEDKVHLSRMHPRALFEMPQLQLGTSGHEQLASEAKKETKAEIDERIGKGEVLAICEMDFVAELNGVQIIGRPDFFVFQSHRSFLILDFKFTNSIKPHTNQIAQVQIYGLMSELMGYVPDQLVLGIVMLPPLLNSSEDEALSMSKLIELLRIKQTTLQSISRACEQARHSMLGSNEEQHAFIHESSRVYLSRYDSEQAKKFARWSMDYWIGNREPLPVGKMPFESTWKGKCKSCEFNAQGLCEHALDKPSKEMIARVAGAKPLVSPLPLVD